MKIWAQHISIRFASDQSLGQVPAETNCFIHLVKKMRQVSPFNPPLLQVFNQICPSPEGKVLASLLSKHALPPDLDDKIDELSGQGNAAQAHDLILAELSVMLATWLQPVDWLADVEFGIDMARGCQTLFHKICSTGLEYLVGSVVRAKRHVSEGG